MSKETWRDLPLGAVSIRSSLEYHTGDWGVEAPRIDHQRCTKCTLCHYYCPEGAIEMREDGYTEPNLDYCKGCGICAKECPVQCIEMVRKSE